MQWAGVARPGRALDGVLVNLHHTNALWHVSDEVARACTAAAARRVDPVISCDKTATMLAIQFNKKERATP
ncbi:hypothetical protein [Burkholderia ubonensis]|uniref:hypothetical protein n=1 Tax=Burkholderia ubonensis TaxID=101571 RepID=UPI000AE54330|nr:hypothetical protein [Burkholderia ubonensis]